MQVSFVTHIALPAIHSNKTDGDATAASSDISADFWTLVDRLNLHLRLLDMPVDDDEERPTTVYAQTIRVHRMGEWRGFLQCESGLQSWVCSLFDAQFPIRIKVTLHEEQRDVSISWHADEQPLAEQIVQYWTKLCAGDYK